MAYMLLLLLVIPLAGAALTPLMRSGCAARIWSLLVTLATAVVAVVLTTAHPAGAAGDFVTLGGTSSNAFSLVGPGFNFAFSLGFDAITMWLVLLTVVLMPLALVSSWGSIRTRETEYYAWMQLLMAAMLGVFVSRDLLLFYIFFELTLVPMFFIIGIWGGPNRRPAAAKFFLFTFAGSVFTLAAVIYIGLHVGTFDLASIVSWAQTQATNSERFLLMLGLLAGLAVKVPLFPVHTWLPLAHTEAPTAGSVILAGVLLKLGTYGLLKLVLPIGIIGLENSNVIIGKLVFWHVTMPGMIKILGVLCVVGILYGALVAWVQEDIKKLVAYSSVSHLGFCVLGMLALNEIGLQGSVLYMINHGISTGAMFLVIGMIYDRYHTRDINELSGLAKKMPRMAFFFIFFVMASIGLPGTNGFVSEFLSILGAFKSEYLGVAFGVPAALGIILGAVYMLHMSACVIFGPLKTPGDHGDAHGHGGHGEAATQHQGPSGDLNGREMSLLIPLAILVLVLGIKPGFVMDTLSAPLKALVTVVTPVASGAADQTQGTAAAMGLMPVQVTAGSSTVGQTIANEPIAGESKMGPTAQLNLDVDGLILLPKSELSGVVVSAPANVE